MSLLDHTLGILLHPEQEWHLIRQQKGTFHGVYMSHVPLLALIPVLSSCFSITQRGWEFGDAKPAKLSLDSALLLHALIYFGLLMGVFVVGEFINWMSKTFGVKGPADRVHYDGTALAVFITTPLFLAGACLSVPVLWFNGVVMGISGAYAVYLIYEGVPILMNIDKDRAFLYASSIVTVGLVVMVSLMIGVFALWGLVIGPEFVD